MASISTPSALTRTRLKETRPEEGVGWLAAHAVDIQEADWLASLEWEHCTIGDQL